MKSNWEKVRLDELITIKHGFAFKGQYFVNDPTSDVLVTPGNFFIGGGFDISKRKYYSGPIDDEYVLKADDLIVTMTDLSKNSDTLGYSAKVPKGDNVRYLHNQRIGLINLVRSSVSKDFLYWLLRSRHYHTFIVNSSTGTTVKHTSPSRIGEYQFFLPSFPEQEKIANILSSFEEKIEINKKIIDNLESSMVSLFNERCAKASGKKTSLSKIACFLNGLAMQKFPAESGKIALPVLKIKELRQKFCDAYSDLCSSDINDQYLVDDGDLIFSWSGSLLVDIWTGGRCGLNQHLFKVTSELYPKWFVYLWIKFHIDKFIAIAQAMATTMGHIKRKDLDMAEVIIPDDSELERWGKIFQPRLDLLINLRLQNVALTKIRNLLLPKLLSGEIELSN